nr:MAG TPA: tail protein [Caudoviricetes sp.]
MSGPIQTYLRLLFTEAGKSVSENILPDLLSFTYDDKETNEADEISLTLKDPTGKWASKWKPDGGEVVRAYIASGTVDGKKGRELFCGKFFVDSLRTSGSPRVFEMRAVSIPMNTPIRRKMVTKAWEKKTLKGIAQEIAAAAKVKLLFDSKEDPSYDRQDQKAESNLKFLSRLCEDAGLSIKVTDSQIVIFDQAFYEKKKPVKTLTLGVSDILSWDFESQQSETYKSCTISYRNPKEKKKGSSGSYVTGDFSDIDKKAVAVASDDDYDINADPKKKVNPAVMTYTYTDPDAEENGQEYQVKKRATSLSEAKRIAKATLRKLNLRKMTGSLSLVGDTSLVAGVVINLKGFGSFDGAFIIESASHSVSTSGYVTSLSVRRVNNNY